MHKESNRSLLVLVPWKCTAEELDGVHRESWSVTGGVDGIQILRFSKEDYYATRYRAANDVCEWTNLQPTFVAPSISSV